MEKIKIGIIAVDVSVGVANALVLPAHSHGGKTHGEQTFTAFQTLQKTEQIYDRLITSGKLTEEWED